VRGRLALIEFCREHGIAFDLCGKVIVALDQAELPRLTAIHERGKANGVQCRRISPGELGEIEPNCAGVEGLFVEDAGIVDFPGVCQKLMEQIISMGGTFRFGEKVAGLHEQCGVTHICTTQDTYNAHLIINCAGLYSDKVAAMDLDPECQIVPFRGEYYLLKPERRYLVRNLIYPVPDPSFPFLGVHFTRRIAGAIECGPNAVLAFAREGYRKSDIHLGELAGTLMSPSFMKLACRHWRMGFGEYVRSFSKAAFVTALQKLLPAIQSEDLEPAPAGVRAQALGNNGNLIDDFLIREGRSSIHVCNAPSPAATACLTIGEEVARRALAKLA
jgi:L-2-hydroxyglutarate oxidase